MRRLPLVTAHRRARMSRVPVVSRPNASLAPLSIWQADAIHAAPVPAQRGSARDLSSQIGLWITAHLVLTRPNAAMCQLSSDARG